jgi:hypothetical protein
VDDEGDGGYIDGYIDSYIDGYITMDDEGDGGQQRASSPDEDR